LTNAISLVGLMRAGYVPIMISPRNSAAAVTNFIAKGDVKHLLLGREAVFEEVAIASFDILRQQYPAHSQPTTSKLFSFEDFSESNLIGEDIQPVKVSPNDILFYMHSSG
jgi:acyl-coenzyme A synthetase/AMP-(fatty) acid ligase